MDQKVFVEKINNYGGKVYIVGGWVRDKIRKATPKDKDYVITGLEENIFCTLFPDAIKIGKAFPVYLLEIDEIRSEVAFGRQEEKTGAGYKGFSVSYSTNISIENDLYRRDTTMNSIAFCLQSNTIIDPYYGIRDIRQQIIRATSKHFVEDPIRALRAARQAAQIGFRIEPETIFFMQQCKKELQGEPSKRILLELTKALRTPKPSVFFRCLQQAGLLEITYPQIFRLIGKAQPTSCYPEGDAFEHSMLILDQVAAMTGRIEVRFAALLHDLGKGMMNEKFLQLHYGHEKTGLEALHDFDCQMTLPKVWLSCAEFVIQEHMRVTTMKKPGEIVDLMDRLEKNPLGIEGFSMIIKVDHGQLPTFLIHYKQYMKAIHQKKDIPETLKGKDIGLWIRQKKILACQKLLEEALPKSRTDQKTGGS